MSTEPAKKATSRPQHLCIRPLSIYDVDKIIALEALGFPSHERATEAKLRYRLTVCPELCSGLFIREFETITGAKKHNYKAPHAGDEEKQGDEEDDEDEDDDDDEEHGVNDDSLPPPRSTITSERLIGHVIATKIYDSKITDRSMLIPKLTKDNLPRTNVIDNDKVGHVENSRFLGIHSVVIDPEFQGLKLGSLLLKDYLQKLNQQFVADKVVIIAKNKLIKFYESLGFSDNGKSSCKFGGEEWHDLYYVLTHEEDEDDI